jgi:hypothetical protein
MSAKTTLRWFPGSHVSQHGGDHNKLRDSVKPRIIILNLQILKA